MKTSTLLESAAGEASHLRVERKELIIQNHAISFYIGTQRFITKAVNRTDVTEILLRH
jgi:hypothetical protein